MEVPEIYEKIVRVEASAREPGARSKIAVSSRDRDVDPVGACVGMKGSRVQAVVQELRGEKIDIVPYDDDPARFVCNAIAPAEVSRVIIDAANHTMELIVPDDKLSLGHRQEGAERAPGLAAHRLAHRHPLGNQDARDGGAGARLAGRHRGGNRRDSRGAAARRLGLGRGRGPGRGGRTGRRCPGWATSRRRRG